MLSSGSIKLPWFDGDREKFNLWWTKFVAYAVMRQFGAAIQDKPESDLPAKEEVGANETKANEEARKRNSLAMCSFTMAFQTESLLTMVYKAQTNNWPSGLAYLVVKALFKKYRPDDLMAEVELEAMLSEVGMSGKTDPSVMFEQIENIRNRFRKTSVSISEARLMAAVIAGVPMEYRSVISSTQQVMKGKLTMESLEEALCDHWRVSYCVESEE